MSSKEVKISSLIDKAVFDYKLIEDKDRILIGASGGKDSTVLIEYFAQRAKRPASNFEYKALNIQTDFSPAFPKDIKEKFEELQVPFESIKVNVLERLKDGKKMNCYWCSTQRRTELINYALKKGYNKIALGHHMDDVLETLLMNIFSKAEMSTMIPKLKYEKYPLTLIRPLYYVQEEQIKKYIRELNLDSFTCTCNYQENSSRKGARKKLEELTDSNPLKKQKLFDSLKNINSLYLP